METLHFISNGEDPYSHDTSPLTKVLLGNKHVLPKKKKKCSKRQNDTNRQFINI